MLLYIDQCPDNIFSLNLLVQVFTVQLLQWFSGQAISYCYWLYANYIGWNKIRSRFLKSREKIYNQLGYLLPMEGSWAERWPAVATPILSFLSRRSSSSFCAKSDLFAIR